MENKIKIEEAKTKMNETKEELSQGAKPKGFRGRIIARLMAIGHRTIYKNVAAALNPQPDEKFSAAAAMASFPFWPKPLESLKEIHRVLRPGGRLVISLGWNADDGMNHTKHIKKYGIKLYTGKEMQAMFQEAGFSQSHITYFKGFMMPRGIIACAMK